MTAVVNCTTNIDCFHTGSLDYFTFDVAFWRREVMGRLRGETQNFIRLNFIPTRYYFLSLRHKRANKKNSKTRN